MDNAQYVGARPAEEPCRLVAALAPGMLRLAAERADGAHTYLVSPEHTAQARAVLGPEKVLAVEQTVLLEDDLDAARAWISSVYLKLPNYRASFERQGFGEEDFLDGGSERLLRAVMAIGGVANVITRIREQFEAGADHVCIQVVGRGMERTRAAWRELEAPLREVASGRPAPRGMTD